jgi:catechol 2,3-dioxygenase-like lactoylglutathione lyase family enzyme
MMKMLLTAYRVGDLARSVDFYARVGFREIGRATFENGTTRVMLNLPGDGDVATCSSPVSASQSADRSAIVSYAPSSSRRRIAASIGST